MNARVAKRTRVANLAGSAAIAMVGLCLTGGAMAQPDLQVTAVEVACAVTVPIAPPPTRARMVQRRCDTDHQAELSVTIENKGTSDAVFTAGEIWNLWSYGATTSPIATFVNSPANVVYMPAIDVGESLTFTGQSGAPGQLVSIPKTRTQTLRPGARYVEVVVLVPSRQLTVGSHRFQVRVDPQAKVAESNENNNISAFATLTVEAPPPDEEWVSCPSVGVATRVEMELKQGKVTCRYYHQTRFELMTTSVVESRYLKPFRGCLRSNQYYGSNDETLEEWRNEPRMYCSFTRNMGELARESTEWQPASSNSKRVRFGIRKTPEGTENFELCRVRYAGSLRVGRGWRNRCYIPYQNAEQRVDSGIEFLVLSRPYGVPSGVVSNDYEETRDVQPIADPPAPVGVAINFCTIFLRPDDFAQTLGLAPTLTLWVPGTLLPGGVCISSAQGKVVTSTVSGQHLHGGHILVLR